MAMSSSSSAMASSLLLLRRCCTRLSLTSQPSLSPSTLAANPARNQPGGGANLPFPFLLSSVRHFAKRAKKWQGGRCALHQVSLFILFPFLLPSKLGFRIGTLNPKSYGEWICTLLIVPTCTKISSRNELHTLFTEYRYSCSFHFLCQTNSGLAFCTLNPKS